MNSLDNDRLIYFFLREILGPSAYGVIKLSVFPGAKKKQKNKKKKLKSNTEDPLNSSFVSYWWRKNKSQYSLKRITELKTRWEIWKSETVISLRSFGCDFLSPHGRRITVDSTYKHPIIIFHRFFFLWLNRFRKLSVTLQRQFQARTGNDFAADYIYGEGLVA